MGKNWTPEEDDLLRQLILQYGKQWSIIASFIPGRSATQVSSRWEKCINPDLIKGAFTVQEDQIIREFVQVNGPRAWGKIVTVLPHRSPKQCRERWSNNLSPDVDKGPWTSEEDLIIFDSFKKFGPKWSLIAQFIDGRTDNAVKNRWNASLSKRIVADQKGGQSLSPAKFRKYSKNSRNELEKAPETIEGESAMVCCELPFPTSPLPITHDDWRTEVSSLGISPRLEGILGMDTPQCGFFL
jgi:hypothetical protein